MTCTHAPVVLFLLMPMCPTTAVRPLLTLICLLANTWMANGQVMQIPFGKNRVQYNRQIDDWSVYETANFLTYWYGDARNVAQAAVQIAESEYRSVQQLLEHPLNSKIELLVFTDLTDVKQSNLGDQALLSSRSNHSNGQVGSVIRKGSDKDKKIRWRPTLWQHVHNNPVWGARTKSAYEQVGNKILVYFNGDHRNLRAQIREGLSAVILSSMLSGGNLQEAVQNAVLLNLPVWYTEGLTAYCGEEWNTDLDNDLRDQLMHNRYKTFDKLAKEHPRLAGHAFWYYIGLHFGKSTVSNLLYLTRINRSLDAGFLYVLGSGYRRTGDALMEYFRNRYRQETQFMKKPPTEGALVLKNKHDRPITQYKISPDGKRIAWVQNDLGRWQVFSQVLGKNGRRKRLLHGGTRSPVEATDYGYPLIAFSPDNRQIGIIHESRDKGYFTLIDLEKGRKKTDILNTDYQRVYSMDFVNPNEVVLSAAVKGFSDIFLYKISSRQTERITQDFWDDLDAAVVRVDSGQPALVWASNRVNDTLSTARLDTILPLDQYDLFYFDLATRDKELIRITQTPDATERAPMAIDSTYFGLLSNVSGIDNRQLARIEPYTAYYKTIFYLKDGGEIPALNTDQLGEWPLEKAMTLLAPADTVRKNLDSTKIDSVRSFPVLKKRAQVHAFGNYDRSIRHQHTAPRVGRWAEAVRREGRTKLYVRRQPNPETLHKTAAPAYTRFRENALAAAGLPVPLPPLDTTNRNSFASVGLQIDTITDRRTQADSIPEGWQFQMPPYLVPPPTQRPAETEEIVVAPVIDTVGTRPAIGGTTPRRATTRPLVEFSKPDAVARFNPARITPYRLKFRNNYFNATMDNNLLFDGLDTYVGPNNFTTPPAGFLVKGNFKDLLDDYTLEGGARLPITFDGMEYYLFLDNKKHRLDKRIALYRKTKVRSDQAPPGAVPDLIQTRTNTLLGQYEVRYPFSTYFSVRAMGTLRQDRAITLSTNLSTLEKPDRAEQRASLRLSAVYDNSVDVDLNIRTGTRAKVWVEAVKRFEFNTQPRLNLDFNSGFMTVMAFDARHYLPLDRRSILAARLAGATTFGSERILYVMGGVDNWIFPKFNNNIPSPKDDNFAFQTLAAHVRGFSQNIRNGNSYALLNTELRVPIFKYFSRKPTMSNFWRNFQVVGFFDCGTAWQGKTPYAAENPLNTVVISDPRLPIIVRVNYFRDPLVAGYGVGARMQLMGMFLRADYGWGIETRVVQKPILHLALGTDF